MTGKQENIDVYKRQDYKISVKLSEKDMDILDEAVRKSGKTVSEYVRELIRLGGNVCLLYTSGCNSIYVFRNKKNTKTVF